MIASGHSMISRAAITARPAYQPTRGCGRRVTLRGTRVDVLRRCLLVWRRFVRPFVSITLFAFISPSRVVSCSPPDSRHGHAITLFVEVAETDQSHNDRHDGRGRPAERETPAGGFLWSEQAPARRHDDVAIAQRRVVDRRVV